MAKMEDIFGGAFGDIFGNLGKETGNDYGYQPRSCENFSHPKSEDLTSVLYSYARSLKATKIKLLPTKRQTYVIVDVNTTILEEFTDLDEAKKMYIMIIIGQN